MTELTTNDLRSALEQSGVPVSQQLLIDWTRRGLLTSPSRRRRREGGPGSEAYWEASTLDRVIRISKFKAEGLSYEDIRPLLPPIQTESAVRFSTTVWLMPEVARRLDEAARSAGLSKTELMRLGAELFYLAPADVRESHSNAWELIQLMDSSKATEGSNLEFSRWIDLAARFIEHHLALKTGRLPCSGDSTLDAYILWRLIHDGRLSADELQALRITREPVERDGEVVGTLTVFSGHLKLLRPAQCFAGDVDRCRALAKELGAVLITGEGHDFNHAGAAQALARVGDWLRDNAEV